MKIKILCMLLLVYESLTAQNVTIPDANFKKALLNHSPKIDTNNDGEIQVSEATAFTGDLDLIVKNISDLKGIEAFKNITRLSASSNNFSSLDLTQNLKLTDVNLDNNFYLTNVIANKNTSLEILSIRECYKLTTVSLPKTSDALKKIDYTFSNLTSVDISEYNNLESLECSYNYNLTSLKLPTSKNNKLESLGFQKTKISSIDLRKLLNLKYLFLRNTELTTLDLSKNIALQQVFGSDNSKITSINVKNGLNNILKDLELNNCPNLTTICVDDITYANAQDTTRWTKDATASYTENCTLSKITTKDLSNIVIYPNPTKDFLHVNSSNFRVKSVQLYSVTGKKIIDSKSFPVSLSNLHNGVYFLKINNSITKKIIKN